MKTATALVGSVMLTSSGFLVACDRDPNKAAGKVLSVDDQSLIEEVADTLLPTTPSSPGAKAAGSGAAINLLLTDCYEPESQERVVSGLKQFRAMCKERCGGDFMSLSQLQREQVLKQVDAEAQKAGPTHYFSLVRELAHTAYFSSEVGMTKARRYIMVPGKWIGCVDLVPGQPAWA
ncbi:MAG: gluconate 2-dehydrogenase subunit 3 family protein [Gemmatimonadaceae bacterium]